MHLTWTLFNVLDQYLKELDYKNDMRKIPTCSSICQVILHEEWERESYRNTVSSCSDHKHAQSILKDI